MTTVVHLHQEESMKIIEATTEGALTLEPFYYDPIMEGLDDQILSLWLSQAVTFSFFPRFIVLLGN
jgi:hypothetical protein